MYKTVSASRLDRCVRRVASASASVLIALVAPVFAAHAATAASAPVAAPTVATPDQYRIGAGDTLHITVYQSPDLSLDARVNEAGVISYPLLGRVVLGGLTVNAAEAHLAQALKKGEIVKDPQVIIVVTNVRANQVNVLGQVGRPGRLPLDLAGMHLPQGALRQIELLRQIVLLGGSATNLSARGLGHGSGPHQDDVVGPAGGGVAERADRGRQAGEHEEIDLLVFAACLGDVFALLSHEESG